MKFPGYLDVKQSKTSPAAASLVGRTGLFKAVGVCLFVCTVEAGSRFNIEQRLNILHAERKTLSILAF